MRKKILLLSVLAFTALSINAQNGISTNPLSPINPQVPSKANTFFNWMDSIYSYNTDCKSPNTLSPFYKTDNLEALRVNKDMLNKDGWELIRRNFGLTEQNQATIDNVCHSDYILYNKFTGILRVIMKICKTCRNEDFNAAKITVQFENGSLWKTDLLAFSKPDGLKSLDQQLGAAPKFTAGAEYFNDFEKWFYADFPTMYDPCTPNFESKLKIVSELISTATINIQGGISGDVYAKDESGKAKIQKAGSYSWSDFTTDFGKVKKINSSINDYLTSSQGFASSIGGVVGGSNAFTLLADELKNDKMLSAGLKAIPWLGTAIGIFEAFSGGGKSSATPQQIKMMPMTVNLNAKLNGTLTKTAPYHNVIFNTPGAKNNQLDLPIYPYYNEVLGVFNILFKPEIKFNYTQQIVSRTVCSRYCITYYDTVRNYAFTMGSDQVKYVVNPAAGLELQEMKIAIMIDKAKPPTRTFYDTKNGEFTFFGYDGITGKEVWRGDDFFAGCADNTKLTMQLKKNGGMIYNQWEPQAAYVQFILNFKRTNCPPGERCQNVLQVYKFPATLSRLSTLSVTPTTSTCQDTIPLPQQTTAAISSFCSQGVYANDGTRTRISIAAGQEDITVSSNNDVIGVFPNPANDFLTIRNKTNSSIRSAILLNTNGQTVQVFNSPIFNGNKLPLNKSIQTGTYFLILQTTTMGRKTIKLTILR